MRKVALSNLAINGGPKLRETPFPSRRLIGVEEKEAVMALFDQCIETGESFGYNGPEEEAYCREFAEYMGGGYVDAVNSGTSAIHVALRALEIEPFTEVIVGPITDNGGIMPIPLMNCIPIIADSAPGAFSPGPDQIEKLISPLTSAIVVAHIMGEPADIEGIVAVARRRGIPVVEDCAQAHGARLNGKLLGSFGDISAFSTMFGKHHCSGGQGGLVFTGSEELYRKSRWASDRGKPFDLPEGSTNCIAALNLNLNDLSAVIGRVQLKKLPGIVARRREMVARLTERLKDLPGIFIPDQLPGAEPSYWAWRIGVNTSELVCDKETFCQAVEAEGVCVASSYRQLPHTQDWYVNRRVFGTSGLPWSSRLYKGDPNREFDCPNAMAATENQILVPIFESWGEQEVTDIAAAFEKVCSACSKQ